MMLLLRRPILIMRLHVVEKDTGRLRGLDLSRIRGGREYSIG